MTQYLPSELRPRALIVARTALTPQGGTDESLEWQIAVTRSGAADLKFDVVDELRLPGCSGYAEAVGHALLERVVELNIDVVIVVSLDRLSRSAKQLRVILLALAKRGVVLAAMTERLGVLPAADWLDHELPELEDVR